MASKILRWVGVCLVLGLVSFPAFGNDTSMQPPEPSYSEQWAQMEGGSSPFLDLRNEDTDVAEPESPTVDTVTVNAETAPIAEESETPGGKSNGESDTGDQETRRAQTDTDVRDTEEADTGRPSDSGGTETTTVADGRISEDTKTVEETGAASSPEDGLARNADQPETDSVSGAVATSDTPSSEESDSSENQWARRDRSNTRVRTEALFESATPREAGAVLQPSEIIGGTVPSVPSHFGSLRGDTVLVGSVAQPGREVPFWWRYYVWIAGGLVVSVMIGMFFWFRRRRVEVIETSQSPAGDFFQQQLQRRKPSTLGGSTDREAAGETSTDARTAAGSTDRADPEYQTLVEKMHDEGLNGQFEELLHLYYEQGLDEDEIAERTSRGLGEVGLVIDYADRLRKDMNHGKRA